MKEIMPFDGGTTEGAQAYLFEEELAAVTAGKEHDSYEIEVKVRSRYVGEFDYGHFRFGIWDMGESVGERHLCFKGAMIHRLAGDFKEGTSDGFYHGGGPFDEVAALFALHFRSSFEPGRIVRMSDLPRRTHLHHKPKRMEPDGRNLEEAKPTLDLARTLNPDRKLSFMLALRFYSLALRQMDTEPDLAFISLVSAIEALASNHYRQEEVGFDEQLEGLLNRVIDGKLHAKLRNTLWARGAVKRKVLAFLKDYTAQAFWASEERPGEEFLRVKEDDFVDLLKRIYDARSAFLHTGAALPPVLFFATGGGEIDPSLGAQHGMRKWEPEEYLPHISFIERLVQHVLMEFLHRNQESPQGKHENKAPEL